MIAPESPPPTPPLFEVSQQPSKPLTNPRRLVRGSRRGPKAAAVADRYITFDRIASPSPGASSGPSLRPLPAIPHTTETSRPSPPRSPTPTAGRISTRPRSLTLPSSLVAPDPAIRRRRDRDAPVSPPGWRDRQSWKGPPLVRSVIPLPPSPPSAPRRSPHLASLRADGASLWSTSLATDGASHCAPTPVFDRFLIIATRTQCSRPRHTRRRCQGAADRARRSAAIPSHPSPRSSPRRKNPAGPSASLSPRRATFSRLRHRTRRRFRAGHRRTRPHLRPRTAARQ